MIRKPEDLLKLYCSFGSRDDWNPCSPRMKYGIPGLLFKGTGDFFLALQEAVGSKSGSFFDSAAQGDEP